jgi:hypothetical protein
MGELEVERIRTVGELLVATIGLFLTESPGRVGYLVLVWVSLLTALAALLVGVVPPEGYGGGPGRWLTLLGTLMLAAVHGARVEALRR